MASQELNSVKVNDQEIVFIKRENNGPLMSTSPKKGQPTPFPTPTSTVPLVKPNISGSVVPRPNRPTVPKPSGPKDH